MDAYLGAEIEVQEELASTAEAGSSGNELTLSPTYLGSEMEVAGDLFAAPSSWTFGSSGQEGRVFVGGGGDAFWPTYSLIHEELPTTSTAVRVSHPVVDPKQEEKKFKRGWEELCKRVHLMNERTGTKTTLQAIFDSVTYNLKDKRGAKPSSNQYQHQSSSYSTPSGSSVIETDHRYAAVILTQKESSPSVRDHQYGNDDRDTEEEETTNSNAYIRRRYKRETRLVSYLQAIFAKKRMLEENTSAIIALEVSYEEEYVFNSENFDTAEEILGQRRRKMSRVAVIPTLKVEPLVNGGEEELKTVPSILVRMEKDDDGGEVGVLRRPKVTVHYVTVDSNTNERNSNLLVDHSYWENSNVNSSEDLINCEASETMPQSPVGGERSASVGTSTEPICGVCYSETESGEVEQRGMWLRCFNPLCYFYVHPRCVGFRLNSPSQLALLPPFFCPEHRMT